MKFEGVLLCSKSGFSGLSSRCSSSVLNSKNVLILKIVRESEICVSGERKGL